MSSRRSWVGCVAIALAVAACTGEGAAPSTTTPSTSSSTTTTVAEALPTDVADLPGRLVVLDESGDVVTIAPDGTNPTPITDDAGDGAAYRQPTFSPVEDLVAWAELRTDRFGLGLSDGAGENRVLAEMESPPIYTFWSPDGTTVATLHNSAGAPVIDLDVVDVAAASARVLASGSPFYISWSPDSTQMAVHVEQDVFATLDLEGNSENLGATAQGYLAPHWVGDGILHLADGGLELRPIGGPGRLLAEAPGPVAFVANPRGTMVAVQSFVEETGPGVDVAVSPVPQLPGNRVIVLDLESGEVSEVVDGLSVGMFWSPDGRKLLVLRLGEQGLDLLDVVVWRDGATDQLAAISPHPEFVQQVLQFFSQYSQSLRVWSPDSAAFALAGAVDDEPGIWVYPIEGDGPVEVHDGSWVAWSAD